jgi:hypothetical protein
LVVNWPISEKSRRGGQNFYSMQWSDVSVEKVEDLQKRYGGTLSISEDEKTLILTCPPSEELMAIGRNLKLPKSNTGKNAAKKTRKNGDADIDSDSGVSEVF